MTGFPLVRPVAAVPQALPATRPSAVPVPPTEPWSSRDIVHVVEYLLVATALLGTAWYGASGTTNFSYQVYWVALGIAAMSLLSFGALMFLLGGMREIRRRRLAVMVDLAEVLPLEQAAAPVATAAVGVDDEADWVASALMTHYHRRRCALVRGKAVAFAGLSQMHADAGRVPCGVCAP